MACPDRLAIFFGIGAILVLVAPAAAQEGGYGPADDRAISAEEAVANASRYWSPTRREEPSGCDEPDPDPDTIVVCREWEDGEAYRLNREPPRMLGADNRETGGGAPRAPDFNDSCLHNRGRENCMMGGWVPPPAIMVDFATLPETPADSDAARLYGGPTDADAVAEEVASP